MEVNNLFLQMILKLLLIKNNNMSKLTKSTINELIRIAITTIVSILTTLGVMSCTVNTGNHDVPTRCHADNVATVVEPFE